MSLCDRPGGYRSTGCFSQDKAETVQYYQNEGVCEQDASDNPGCCDKYERSEGGEMGTQQVCSAYSEDTA